MKTEDKIIEAFLTLLKKHPLEKITVSLICKTGKISRVTFYKYFSNFSSLYAFLVFDQFLHHKLNPYGNILDALNAATDFIIHHQHFFQRILASKQRHEFFEFLTKQAIKHHLRWIDRFDPNKVMPASARQMMSRLYASGLIEMVFQWVEDGFNVAKEDFVNHAYLFLKGYMELAVSNHEFYQQYKRLPTSKDLLTLKNTPKL